MNSRSLASLAVDPEGLPDSALTQDEFNFEEPERCGIHSGFEIVGSNFKGVVQVPLSFVSPEEFAGYYW